MAAQEYSNARMEREKAFQDYLKGFITPHKLALMEEVLSRRTRHFTVVLEDIYKAHNASAVLRTADCFGVQDIHMIEKEHAYQVNPYVSRGAAQWVDVHRYQNAGGTAILDCVETLRADGYTLLATSPREGSIPAHQVDPQQKTALIFGNEHAGVSQELIEAADGMVHIPMFGFSESFNISVAASILLHQLRTQVQSSLLSDFYLSEAERFQLRARWYRDIVKNSAIHERQFFSSYEQ
ncbi:MAG: TrmH family RNA methyltransferase [Nitritalea sp.]